jgi:ABC-type multidrug transport system permease subunit
VVCTIHQPSLEIFEAFQELLLLKRGGETIFSGAVGADARNLIAYFSAIDGVPAIKPRINPANWMLEVTSPEAEKQMGVDFAELYAGSELAAAAEAMVDKYSEPPAGEEALRMQDLNVCSSLVQLRELTRRNVRELLRDFSYNGIRTLITLAIAIALATLYANQGQEVGTYAGVLNVAGALYAGSIFVAVMYLFTVQDSLVLRRTVFYREHAAGTYNVIPFWAAELLAEVPFLVVNAMVYSVVAYWSIGFIADAAKFFWYFLMTLLILFTFISFGMMSVHITPNLEISNAFSAFAFSIINLMCGFMKPKQAIPKGWIWLYYLNPASYSLYGMVANQLGDVDTMMQLPPGSVPAEVPVRVFVESYFGFKHSFFGWCALILIAFMVFFRLIALLALKRLNFQQR